MVGLTQRSSNLVVGIIGVVLHRRAAGGLGKAVFVVVVSVSLSGTIRLALYGNAASTFNGKVLGKQTNL